MNERSGGVMHDSVGGNDGRLSNVALGKAGFSGTAYGFNGRDSRVDVPSAGALDPGSSDFAVTVHVKFADPPPVDSFDLVRKGLCCRQYWKVEIHGRKGAGRASCLFKGSNRKLSLRAGPDLADGKWHTIRCQKLARSIKLSVDGRSFAVSGSVGSLANSAKLTIGYKASFDDWYKGVMDEVTIAKG